MFDLGAGPCRVSNPNCGACPLERRCHWRRRRRRPPDPAHRSFATGRPASPFAGSDRQGRGRLITALRQGPLRAADVAAAAGWPDDAARGARVIGDLVADGFVARGGAGEYRLAD
jgi:A/G-specific adenine glycosylase